MKYKRYRAVEGGYSEWINPVMDGYKMACCDCGLVHDMQFRIVKDNPLKDSLNADAVSKQNVALVFRAKRDNRATGQLRRKK